MASEPHDPRTRTIRADPRAGGRAHAGRAADWSARSARDRPWMAVARPAAHAQFVFLRHRLRLPRPMRSSPTTSRCCTSPAIPTRAAAAYYRFAAVWGAHEGSLLLWALMLAAVDARGDACSRARLPAKMVARVLGVMGVDQRRLPAVHAAHLESVSRASLPAPAEGRDLNPVLQDPAHDHPSAAAVHGLRRLLGGVRLRDRGAAARAARCGWARWTRPWTTWPGRSSPAASRSASGGRTTNSAGAAGGSGIRSRTRRSCRGSSARR